jgi:short-subunit dehydrogenase
MSTSVPMLVDTVNFQRAARTTMHDETKSATGFAQRCGPWAVVTGASDGIGRAFAFELAARGLHLVLVARRQPLLDALAAQLHAAHGIHCRVIAADLGDARAVQSLADATQDLDVGLLVAAAGFGTSGPLIETPLAAELDLVAVNCSALLASSWHFARRFVERGSGALVLMSSLLAFHGTPRAANYAASKAYVQSLAEGLRVELAPHGVQVVASAPGPVDSGFAARAGMRMSAALRPDQVARATLDALGRRTTVRPGGLSKLLGWSLATLPRWGRVKVIAMVMQGMTAHQQAGGTAHRRPAD